MNRRHVLCAICILPIGVLNSSALAETSDAIFGTLLGKYVLPNTDGVNRVDYARWKANGEDMSRLNRYLTDQASQIPSKMPRDQAFVFWSNLYNAITLKVVLDRYPVASIRDIKSDSLLDPKAYIGPWRTKRVTIEGRSYSLDEIENDVLRPVFKDPRVHYTINCTAFGCPNLRTKAWSAATLDADLGAAARDFINHPRGVTVLPGNKLKVSSIYRWFGSDFGGNDVAIIAHLRKYAGAALAPALAAGIVIAEDDYDWSLNDVTAVSKSL